MLFRKLEGDELFHARNLWNDEKMPDFIKEKLPWAIPSWRAHGEAFGRGYTTHCPECKKRLSKTYVPGWKKGKTKLVRVHAAQILHCSKCDIFWSTSMLKIEACGYRCRYDN
jgi:hypothetical protein